MTGSGLLIRRLERAMVSMDAISREVYLAHRLDDLSYPQIAERTGLSVAHVERYIAEAILHIDRALREMEREDRT